MRTLIKDAIIVNEGHSFKGSLVLNNNEIEAIFHSNQATSYTIEDDTKVINAKGSILIPGVIDTHVHFRDPGLTHKATWGSESFAAAAGGVTTVADMPNTIPATTSIEALEEKYTIAEKSSLINFACFLGATKDNLQKIAKLTPKNALGVKVFMGSSTGNMLLQNDRHLEQLFAECPLPLVAHCEDDAIIQTNLQKAIAQFGTAIPFTQHANIRSAEACVRATDKAIRLALKYGTKLHIAHLSTAEEISLFEPNNKHITAEVSPQYLWFCDNDYEKRGALLKCNPSIKNSAARSALRKAIISGHISSIASDHAPHTLIEKQALYLEAPSGLPSIQHNLLAMLEFVKNGEFTIETIIEKMCHAPARIFNIAKRGFIRTGYTADLCLLKPCDPWAVEASNTLHLCKWSAFDRQQFSHQITHTFVNGSLAYKLGEFNGSVRGARI
ncbi:MAG: dihydroorotase [Bacteroidales bacterium]